MQYVEVAITKQRTGGRFFSYHSEDALAVGDFVRVPYGRTKAIGFITAIVKKPTFTTKAISTILPYRLPIKSLELFTWMVTFYPDDPGLIAALFVPPGIVNAPRALDVKIATGAGATLPTANVGQQEALRVLHNLNTNRTLLHGDTGSGKTRVFTEIIQETLKSGMSVLVLTPEIGLTPQLANDITAHVNSPVITTHSGLGPAARRRIWQQARESTEPTVFIGPRSALFLPLSNIGLIVIDEAHDSSFKQDNAPRYQALHVSGKLAMLHDAKLIQSTATPNVADYQLAKANNFAVVRMTGNAAGSAEATCQLVDLTDRSLFTKSQYISDSALTAMDSALQRGEQSMLFLNRRGTARLVQCSDCGWQAVCPHCGLPLTYHHDEHSFRCHTCAYREPAKTSCPSCGSAELSFKAIGTKALLDHVQSLFPKARVQRFDADVSSSEQLHHHIDALKDGEVDIVIGTQLISKGMDLKNLSVVVVVNADTGLNLPDFSAEESTFQQLYQVTGRTGRGHILSTSFIQTRLPENPVMQAVLHRSYEDFYTYELHKRESFTYPPFCHLALLSVKKKSAKIAEREAIKFFEILSKKSSGIQLLGPSPSFYEKRGEHYHWNIILKAKKRSTIVELARDLPADWVADINPSSLL